MPQIGPLEILTVAVLALIVFGPQRLPEIARNIGKAVNEMRRMTAEMRTELHDGMSTADLDADADDEADDDAEPPEPAKAVPADPDEQER